MLQNKFVRVPRDNLRQIITTQFAVEGDWRISGLGRFNTKLLQIEQKRYPTGGPFSFFTLALAMKMHLLGLTKVATVLLNLSCLRQKDVKAT